MNSNPVYVHVLALVGSLLYMCAAIPALYVVLRDRDADSVSPATLDLLTLSGIWWIVYSWDIQNWPSLISSMVAVCSPIIIVILKLMNKQFPLKALLFLFAGLVALVVMEEISATDVGLIAALFSFLIVAPTAWGVLIRKQPAPHASAWFWLMQATTALVWLIYGIAIGHPILGATGLIVAPTAFLISLSVKNTKKNALVSV